MKSNTLLVAALTALVVGAAFYGGISFQKSKTPVFPRVPGSGAMMRGQNGDQMLRTGFRPVAGEIINADDQTITVKLQDGSSKVIVFSDNTVINKASQATKGELVAGVTVAVFGTENSDGSVTAQSVQLNPERRNEVQPNQ